MNKKIVTLILVMLVSLCFLSIVVADNALHNDKNTTDHGKTIHKDKKVGKDKISDKNNTTDKNKTSDKNKTDKNSTDKNKTDKNKTDDKSKKNYILAKGKGNDIKFSDGFRGFILDYSKSAASPGDEFKHASASKAHNSNTLKLAIIECYRQNMTDHIGGIMADFVKTGSSPSKVGEAVAASNESVGDHDTVKINNHTEAHFDFEVLKSVSGNESDYFAYKVSFTTIDDGENATNQTNDTADVTNTTTNVTNTTNTTNSTNITKNDTNKTNMTDMFLPMYDEPDYTLLDGLYNYLGLLTNALYDAWKPLFDTVINDFLMAINALNELAKMYQDFMAQLNSLMNGLEKLLKMAESMWKELAGLLKLFESLLAQLEQFLKLIESILHYLEELISAIIALIQQLIDFLIGLINYIIDLIMSLINFLIDLIMSLINFLLDLINQLLALLKAILDFLKSLGSFMVSVIENAVVLVGAFVLITIGAFIYNRTR